MNKTILGILLVSLLASTLAQNFAGGYLPHLYTGYNIAQLTGTDILQNTTFSSSLDRSVFDLGEQVFIATSLQDFTYYSGVQTAPNVYYVHIEIVNPTMSTNQRMFQFNINTINSRANTLNVPLKIKRVRLGYLLVGSNFGGYYSPSQPSSYIFARNSDMFSLASSGRTLVDFKTTTAESPFLYTPTPTTNYPGCGAVKKNGYWIVQTANCSKITATMFVTGFDMPAPTAANSYHGFALGLGAGAGTAVVESVQTDLKAPSTAQTFATFTSDNTKDGISILPPVNVVKFVQLSMVVIALRQYASATYPLQGTFIDNFDANSYIDPNFRTYASSRIAMAEGSFAAPYYNNFDPNKFGHMFCGLTGFRWSITSVLPVAGNDKYVGFIVSQPDPNPILPLDTLNIELYTPPSPLTNVLDMTTNPLRIAESCLLLTSSTPCIQSLTPITLSSPTVVINPTTSATATFTGTGSYATSGDPNLLSPVSVLATQSVTSATTITYTIQVPASSLKVGVYEGVLFISTPIGSIPAPAQPATVTIDAFGSQIVSSTDNIQGAKTFHFSFVNNNLANNTIVITYSTATPVNPISNQVLEFGIFSHNTVLSLNQTCATTCANVTGYIAGATYTTSPPTCIICDTSINLVFSTLTGTCVCGNGYYLNSAGQCAVCSVNLCGACTTNTASCSQCVPLAVFVDPATPVNGCACIAGYYRSGNTCLKCAPGCLNCTTGTQCTTCVANSNTRQNTTLNCACLPGYYEVNQPVCPACSSECLTCVGTSTNCTSCNTTGFFNQVGTTCQCANGYYLAIVNGAAQCLKCHFSCANCTGDAASCISCKTVQWTKVGSQCVCNKVLQYVYYQNLTIDGICVDQKCTAIDPQCVECSIILFTGQPICKACNNLGNFTLSSDNKTCVCKPGFYNVNGSCVACGNGCQNCSSASTCTQCAFGAIGNGGGTCTCPPGTYLSTAFVGIQCLQCDPNCAQCQIASGICTRCQNGFVSINNTCVCQVGKYATPDNVYCNNCMTGCSQCNNGTVCIGCSNGYILSSGTCQLTCPIGTFNAGDQCLQCADGCRSCNSAIDCKICNTGLFLFLGGCRSVCPSGTFLFSSTLCIACNQSCATCSGSPNTCLSCNNALILNNGQCLQSCSAGTYYNGVNCVPCMSPCTTCQTTATRCTGCPQGQYLYNNACTAQCPTAIVNGVCTNICPDGSYLSGTICQRCSLTCRTCSSASVCTSCNNNLVVYRGACQAGCPANTILSGGACLDCDANCVGCSGSTTSCTNCVAGTYRLIDRCYSQCPPTYYSDFATASCKKCDANCNSCSGPGQCITCIGNTVPINGLCTNNCGANCLSCTGSTCTQCANNLYWNGLTCQSFCPPPSTPLSGVCVCPSGQFLNAGSCVTSCNLGFTNVNNVCIACQTPCKTCSNSITSCDSCIDGYTFDQVNRKCTQSITCPFGQYSSTFGDCRYICPDGTYYLDSACYVGRCPVGYDIETRNRVCVKSSSNTGCTSPLFLQGSNCVNTCDAGFYPNTNTRICTPCSPNCAACSGPNTCTSCAPGTSLSGNVCIVSPDACPAGQYRYNDICVGACPFGTFNNNGYCVRLCASGLYYYNSGCYSTCPTNLSTINGCVVVCPIGTSRNGNLCTSVTQNCAQGQYLNSATGLCDNCRYPCSTCSGFSSFCTSCVASFTLRNGVCISDSSCPAGSYASTTGCQRCPVKCATCSDANTCTSCAAGYTNTGADCVQSNTPLIPVTLQTVGTVKSGNIAYVQIQPNILPNNLPTNLASQIVLFIPSIQNAVSQVNIWVQNGMIFVALTHPGPIPNYQATFILNSNVFDSIYRSMGYSTANAFVQTSISSSLPDAPINIQIPPTAMASKVFSLSTVGVKLSLKLNSLVNRAVAGYEKID